VESDLLRNVDWRKSAVKKKEKRKKIKLKKILRIKIFNEEKAKY